MVGLAKQIAPACDLQVGNANRNALFKNVDKQKVPGILLRGTFREDVTTVFLATLS